MDQDKNQRESFPEQEWLKTISDVPISDLGKKKGPVFIAPDSIPEMPPDIGAGEIPGSGPIVDVIGEGGFARVYKVHNWKLDLDRAVKVLLPTGKKEVSERFLTEARITARLDHPNIVKVFRVDEWSGCPFIEMEFIDGKSLESILTERGPFPPYAACAVGIFIAQALHYAHTLDFILSEKHYKGVIHRDLKPANIMLHSDGRLKLMDFGIARPISTGLHTMGENIVGTLQYLSPEQLNHRNIDQRTDIYAVGAILYELLCGIKAFPDEGLTDLVNKKACGIYKSFGEFPLSIPRKLTEIVDKCLYVNKEERYADAKSLLAALNVAFAQFSSVKPEEALKNFMENPAYNPAPKRTAKKRLSFPKLRLPKWHLPPIPKIQMPSFPQIHFPKFSGLKFLINKIAGLPQMLLSALKGFLAFWLGLFAKILKRFCSAVSSLISFIKHIPKVVYGVAGGLLLSFPLVIYIAIQTRDKGSIHTASKTSADSAIIFAYKIPVADDKDKKEIFIPEILNPAFNDIVQSETLSVIWHQIASADSYTVQIDTGDTVYTTWRETVHKDTFCIITDIKPGAYHCRVGIVTEDGKYFWSAPNYFQYSPVYKIPRTLSPSHEDTCRNREITFQWTKALNAKAYNIAVASDSGFRELILDSNGCRDTSLTAIFYDTSLTYFWRVQTVTGNEWSSTSAFLLKDRRNYCSEVASALGKGRLLSAEKLINKISPAEQCKDTLLVRLADGYLQKGNTEKAESLLAQVTLQDIFVCYLKSRILVSNGEYATALSLLDSAVNTETLFRSWEDSTRVIYWRAEMAQMAYENKKEPAKGKKAYYAWESVLKRYSSDKTHPNYKQAVIKMNQLYHTDKIFSSDKDSLKARLSNDNAVEESSGKQKKKRWLQQIKPLR